MDYAAIKRTFDHYDKDHNGKISREEFMAIYSKHSADGGKSTVDYFLKTYDRNHDGFISFDEFVLMMTGGKGLPPQAVTTPSQQQQYSHQPVKSHQQEFKVPAQQAQAAPVSGPVRVDPQAQPGYQQLLDPVKQHLPSTQHAFKLCPMGTPLNQAHLENKQVYLPSNPQNAAKPQTNVQRHLSAAAGGQHQPRAPSPGDGPHCDKQVTKTAIEGLLAVGAAVQQSAGAKQQSGQFVPAGKPKNPYI